MSESKDQAATQSKDKALSFDEQFEKGWDQVELMTSQEATAKDKAKPIPAAEKIEAKPDVSTSEKTPYKILKVQGKEVPVYSEEEYDALASKGLDYTKKTQTLADERRTAESQLKDEEKRLADASNELNKTLDKLMEMKKNERPGTPELPNDTKAAEGDRPADEVKIYEEFEIDPRFAQPHEVKFVKEILSQRKELAEIKSITTRITQEKADAQIRAIIAKERETHPYEDVIDDQGVNITEAQLASIITAKRTAAEKAGEKPDPMQLLKEGVQEIHLAQQKTKDALSISDQMDPEAFMRNFPGLAEKVRAKLTADPKALVPPSLPGARRQVDTSRATKPTHSSGKSFSDFLDAGFNDPDTIKALTGG
jgi:hypothetical protein